MITTVLLFVSLVICLLVVSKIRINSLRSAFRDVSTGKLLIPGPDPLPVLGSALSLLPYRDVLQFFSDSCAKFGELHLLWLGSQPFVIVNNPILVREVLTSTSSANSLYKKGVFADYMKPLMGNGLLTSEGDIWRFHHKHVAPAFQPHLLRRSIPDMNERIHSMLDLWSRHYTHGTVEVCHEMSRLALDNIGVMGFGSHFGAVEDVTGRISIFYEVKQLLKEMQKRAEQFVPVWKVMPLARWAFARNNDKVHRLVRSKLAQRRQMHQSERAKSTSRHDVIIDLMIDAKEQNEDVTEAEVEDEMITTIMGGHETTSSMLSFALYLLVTHPDVERKVIAELQEVLGRERFAKADGLSADDIDRLEYLEAVLHETLRLYPSAPVFNRTTTSPVTIGGFHVPTGTEVLLFPFLLHRDPKYWDQPEVFMPERWLKPTQSAASAVKAGAYLPFGGGPRKCLGSTFALMEGKLVIGSILMRFTLELLPNPKVEAEMTITLQMRNGMRCAFRPRRTDARVRIN